jgi:hypothetical protein
MMPEEENWKARALEAENRLKALEAWIDIPESAIKLEAERLWQDAERIAVAQHNGNRNHGHIMADSYYEPVPSMQRRHFLKLAIDRILKGGLPFTSLL